MSVLFVASFFVLIFGRFSVRCWCHFGTLWGANIFNFWHRLLDHFAFKMTSKMVPKSIKMPSKINSVFIFCYGFWLLKACPDLQKVRFSSRFLMILLKSPFSTLLAILLKKPRKIGPKSMTNPLKMPSGILSKK